jgi:hypothetical protein
MSLVAADEFRRAVRSHLTALTSSLQPVLEALVQYDYPREVVRLDFEVFSDCFTSQFPVRAFFVDRDNTEFFLFESGVARFPSPVDPGLLQIHGVYPEALENELIARDPSEDPWSIATAELIGWFWESWKSAGGEHFPLVAAISHHDSSQEFDLRAGRWRSRCDVVP